MNKNIALLLIPIFLSFWIQNTSAAELPTTTLPVKEVQKVDDLTNTFEAIQSERKLLKDQITKVETDISDMETNISDMEREATINKRIKLYMKDYKLSAKETAFQTAIEIKNPEYFNNNSMDSELYSFVPSKLPKLLKGEIVPSNYMKYYVAAGEKYNVDWSILASIHDIETTFSTDPKMISSVGAVGHMQFMPATFQAYGVDADGDGKADPWSLPDAIYSAANYLSANGFSKDERKAIWHYNHADWYVNKVINTAAMIKAS